MLHDEINGRERSGLERSPQTVGADLRELVTNGLGGLPLPGSGDTLGRWGALAEITARDVVLGRLAEGHADAVAVVAEAQRPDVVDGVTGVWASSAFGSGLHATPTRGGWLLEGRLRYCSGARVLDQALMTARAPDGLRLFLVGLDHPAVSPVPGTWPAVGMDDSDSLDVDVRGLSAPAEAAVGGPGFYLSRRGFWAGGIGVAACWYGGALAVTRFLREQVAVRPPSPHRLAHLGACIAACESMWANLADAATVVDGPAGQLRPLALRVRHVVERGVAEVLERSGRALGAGPLSHDPVHARRVADLPVYVRQQHAEADLEALGQASLEGWDLTSGPGPVTSSGR